MPHSSTNTSLLGQKAQQKGHTFIDLNQDGIDDGLQDPNFFAHMTMQIHQERPGLLSQLFGRRRRHPRRRYTCHDGVHLSAPFEVEDISASGEADGGYETPGGVFP